MDAVEQNMHTVHVKLFKAVPQMKVGHAIFMKDLLERSAVKCLEWTVFAR